MTSEERQAFFAQNGYWPTKFEPRKTQPQVQVDQRLYFKARLQARWRSRWSSPAFDHLPPAFDNPGWMYQELGHEEFCRQVDEYYDTVVQGSVEKARRMHTRWAIRQILRNFGTQVRGFRRQSVSGRGGIFVTSSDVLTMPEALVTGEGRFLTDLEAALKAYALPAEEHPDILAEVRDSLSKIWGVKC